MSSHILTLFKSVAGLFKKQVPKAPRIPKTWDFTDCTKYVFRASTDLSEVTLYGVIHRAFGIKVGDNIILSKGHGTHGNYKIEKIEFESNGVFFIAHLRLDPRIPVLFFGEERGA